jgi:hypothetical protein
VSDGVKFPYRLFQNFLGRAGCDLEREKRARAQQQRRQQHGREAQDEARAQ